MASSVMQQYAPGDPRMIDTIVHQLKSQGIFDQFRKECIADVDTKPAYQNLHQRVESTVSGFLAHQVWRPDLNKNQLRESLRKHIHDSGFLDIGVERIVDQVVNPKINSVLVPQVEDVVYKFIGMEKPKKRLDFLHNPPPSLFSFHVDAHDKKKDVSLTDLLPKDLDPVSPESDATKKSDDSADDGEFDEDKGCDDEASPPFEHIAQVNDNSVGSHLSGISGLTSPDGRHSSISFVGNKTPMQTVPMESNNDSQLSKVSSGSHLSISFDELDKSTKRPSEVTPMNVDASDATSANKMEIQDRPSEHLVESDSSKSSDELPKSVSATRHESFESASFTDDSSCSAPEYETREDYSPLNSNDEQEELLFTYFDKSKADKIKAAEKPRVEQEEVSKAAQREREEVSKHEREDKKSVIKGKEEKCVETCQQDAVKTEKDRTVKSSSEAVKSSKKDNKTSKELDYLKKEKKEGKGNVEDREKKIERDSKVKTEEKESYKKKTDVDSLKKIEKGKETKKHDKPKSDKSIKREEKDKKAVKSEERPVKKEEKDKAEKKEEKEHKPSKKDYKPKSEHENGSHESKRRESSSHTSHRPKSDKEKHQSISKSSRSHDDGEKSGKLDKHPAKDDKTKRDDKHKPKNGKVDKDKSSKSDDKTVKDKDRSTKKVESVKGEKDRKDSKSKGSSGDKGKDGKRRDKAKSTDDHDKHRERRSEDRRSTDRDSNGTTRDAAPGSSRATSGGTTQQRHDAKEDKKEGKSRNGGNADAAGTSRGTKDAATSSAKSSFIKRPVEELREEYFCTEDEGKLTLKIKKPKIAANIFEVQRIIQMRKSLAKMEMQRRKELCAVQDLIDSTGETDNGEGKTSEGEGQDQTAERQLTSEDAVLSPQLFNRSPFPRRSESDDMDDLKGFEETYFEANQNFVDYIKRISASSELCDIDVSSVSTDDLEYLSDSEISEDISDCSNTRLPYPDIVLSPCNDRVNQVLSTFETSHHNSTTNETKVIGQSTPALVKVEVVPKSQIPAIISTQSLPMDANILLPLVEPQQITNEMRPPANTVCPSDKRETRRARKPNNRYLSDDYSLEPDDEEPDKKPAAKRHAATYSKPPNAAKKHKLTILSTSIIASQLHRDVGEGHHDGPDPHERLNGRGTDGREGSTSPPESERRTGCQLGPSRRVGLGRPRLPPRVGVTKVADLELSRVSTPPNSDFVMPLSPESDVSASSGEQVAKKGATEVASPPSKAEEEGLMLAGLKEGKKNQRGATTTTKAQRYTSDDLYKPRPLFNRPTRRTRGSSPVQNSEVAADCEVRPVAVTIDSKLHTPKQQR